MPPELRSSIRLATPPGRDAAVLRFGNQSFACRLVNESCGGFGVLAPKGAPVFVGMLAALGAEGGWHRVQIAHVQEEGDEQLVGLERKGELPSDWHLRDKDGIWFKGGRGAKSNPGWASWVTGAVFVTGLVVALAVWSRTGTESLADPAKQVTAAAAGTVNAAAQHVDAAAGSVASATKQLSAVAFAPQLLPDVGALLSGPAAEKLNLTEEQRSKISTVVRERDEALHKIYGQATSGGLQALQLEVAWKQRAASEQVWNALTDDQRQQLAEAHKKRKKRK